MRNTETSAAWEYHRSTRHSLQSVNTDHHHMDWSNQPRSYKLYADLEEALALPQELPRSVVPALTAVSAEGVPEREKAIPDLKLLTALLYFSAGVTKVFQVAGGKMAFRAAACTGALYHIELYLVCGELPGLEAGVYHFGAHDMALRQLRSGDYRRFLAKAAGSEPGVSAAPVTIVFTSTYWRNAWKYQARTYRHSFWDSGTILANLLAVASANRLPARIVEGFDDDQVNRLLALDDEREVALGLVPLGHDPAKIPGPEPQVDHLRLETVPLSKTEVDYPAIRAMHKASSLAGEVVVGKWRSRAQPTTLPAPAGELVPLRPLAPDAAPQEPIETVIIRRGSARRFERSSITFKQLSTILSVATGGIPADFLEPRGGALSDLYLIVNAVEGLSSGTYVLHRDGQALELLAAGDFRKEAGYLDLGQELAADAAVNVYFLTDLAPLLEQYGNRGYRLAQLEASITAGKLYLAAYALKLGATGLTFFDDDVTDFFSPHAKGKSVMFLNAVGNKAKRRAN